ncbi:uncharacterized protein LOC114194838 [Vigna unguiculata]|uniref:uncharacterized protein LOC114194838 n=1 Tax=Vigna unguiculata TaxID=3917 RepID=UPI001015CA2B|nr:uncharacterized protein LOC114194838 [Vigna unguiculata]
MITFLVEADGANPGGRSDGGSDAVTEVYWGEAKRGNFWSRVSTEAKIPSFRLRLWSNRSHIQLTPGAFEALGTTLSHAIQLLQSCGVNFKLTSCKAPFSLAPPPSLLPPPATVGGDEGGTSRATFSGLSFALFLCVYAVFN